MYAAIADRPVWLAANTSSDETELVIPDLHGALQLRFPNLLTVIAPKDTAQALQGAAKLRSLGMKVTQWSELFQVSVCLHALHTTDVQL